MIKIKTSSGFECEINSNKKNDWRLLKAISKCEHSETALEGGIELEAALLGPDGSDALEKHLEEQDGYVDISKLFDELREILDQIDDSKN